MTPMGVIFRSAFTRRPSNPAMHLVACCFSSLDLLSYSFDDSHEPTPKALDAPINFRVSFFPFRSGTIYACRGTQSLG